MYYIEICAACLGTAVLGAVVFFAAVLVLL
jgi:hypothetical protein